MQTKTIIVEKPVPPTRLTLGQLKPGTLYYWIMGGVGRRCHVILTPPVNFPKHYIAWGILDTNSHAPLVYTEGCPDFGINPEFEAIPPGSDICLKMTA